MKTKFILGIVGLFYVTMALNSCKNEAEAITPPSDDILGRGFHLLTQNCFSCHNPDANALHSAAPGMFELKSAYDARSSNFEEFKELLVRFLKSPSASNSQMPEALEKYPLMPAMSYSDEQFHAIASYIYFSEMEEKTWYSLHFEKEKARFAEFREKTEPLETGLQYAMQTKAVLGKNLMNAINTKGTPAALEFCSNRAFQLTDSMATALNVKIKRVSDLNRNPENVADSIQLAYIESCKIQLAEGKKPLPKISEKDGKNIAFYPITTEEMCMQCHGNPQSDISAETLNQITKKYPEDKAVGYQPGQIRGAWVVEWNKN